MNPVLISNMAALIAASTAGYVLGKAVETKNYIIIVAMVLVLVSSVLTLAFRS